MVRVGIMANLMADPIMKIIRESSQGNINTVEQKLAEKVAKIKTTEDVAEKGRKFGFLVVVLGRKKYDTVIGNPAVQWVTLKGPRRYNETIEAKYSSFNQSKGEKKHARKVFLGVEESIRTPLLQVVEEPYLEALKEEYIRYGRRTPFEMIEHLWTRISKVTNKDTV